MMSMDTANLTTVSLRGSVSRAELMHRRSPRKSPGAQREFGFLRSPFGSGLQRRWHANVDRADFSSSAAASGGSPNTLSSMISTSRCNTQPAALSREIGSISFGAG